MQKDYKYRDLKSSSHDKKNGKGNRSLIFILILIIGGFIWRDFKLNDFVQPHTGKVGDFVSRALNTFKSFRKVNSKKDKENRPIKVVRKQKGETIFEFQDAQKMDNLETYYLDLLQTSNFALADKLRAHVTLLGLPVLIKTSRRTHLVVSGPYHSLSAVKQASQRLISHKIRSVVRTVKNQKKNPS